MSFWQLSFCKQGVADNFKYNYCRKANYHAIREKLSGINWKRQFENKSVSGMWECFAQTIGTCVAEHVPLCRQESRTKKLPWISKQQKRLLESGTKHGHRIPRTEALKVSQLLKS